MSVVLHHPDPPFRTKRFILPAARCCHHYLGQGQAPFPRQPTPNDCLTPRVRSKGNMALPLHSNRGPWQGPLQLQTPRGSAQLSPCVCNTVQHLPLLSPAPHPSPRRIDPESIPQETSCMLITTSVSFLENATGSNRKVERTIQ